MLHAACLRDTVPVKTSCFLDHGQELAFNLLQGSWIRKKPSPKVIEARKYEKTDKTTAKKVKNLQGWPVWFLDRLSINQISWTVIHFNPCNPTLYLQITAFVLLNRIFLSNLVVSLVAINVLTWKSFDEFDVLKCRSEGWWFKLWPLPLCCFLRQETLLHIVSLHPEPGCWKRD